MLYDMPDNRASEAMKAIDKEFVDLNELRVATDLEIQELLGNRYPQIEKRVAMITQSLNAIFEKEHTLNLARLVTISKRDARQFLRDLPRCTRSSRRTSLLFAFEGHTVPIDTLMLDYLKEEEVIEPETTLEEVQNSSSTTSRLRNATTFMQPSAPPPNPPATTRGRRKKRRRK